MTLSLFSSSFLPGCNPSRTLSLLQCRCSNICNSCSTIHWTCNSLVFFKEDISKLLICDDFKLFFYTFLIDLSITQYTKIKRLYHLNRVINIQLIISTFCIFSAFFYRYCSLRRFLYSTNIIVILSKQYISQYPLKVNKDLPTRIWCAQFSLEKLRNLKFQVLLSYLILKANLFFSRNTAFIIQRALSTML